MIYFLETAKNCRIERTWDGFAMGSRPSAPQSNVRPRRDQLRSLNTRINPLIVKEELHHDLAHDCLVDT
jgi:hypothetical protein